MYTLTGHYDVDGDRLVPTDPTKSPLRLCRSKRPGRPPYYLKYESGRFVSSIYTEHSPPQFESGGVRYECIKTPTGSIDIEVVRSPKWVENQTDLFDGAGDGTYGKTDTCP